MHGMHDRAMSEEHDHNCYPLVYIAGPIGNDPIGGCRSALEIAGQMVMEDRAVPIVTHLHTFAHVMGIVGYPTQDGSGTPAAERWLFLDGELIRRCDALFRLPGHSPGADRELIYARDVVGIPVFSEERNDHAYVDFCQWSSQWAEDVGCRG